MQDVADADQGVGGRSRRQRWAPAWSPRCRWSLCAEGPTLGEFSALAVLKFLTFLKKGAPHGYFAVRPKHSVAGPPSRRKKKESREEDEETEADGSGHARK